MCDQLNYIKDTKSWAAVDAGTSINVLRLNNKKEATTALDWWAKMHAEANK